MRGNALPVLLLVLSFLAVRSVEADELVHDEFRPRVATDFGHIVDGRYGNSDLKFHPLNRNTVVLQHSAAYGADWRFSGGFKGIIWWPFVINANEPHQRTIRVEPRVSEIRARRDFSGSISGYLEFGFFPYKYNPDAINLGEYLYRSGTYPGIVRSSDGFHLMEHARFEAYGLHARVEQSDAWRHDFNLFSEATTYPVGDLTPAYEITFRKSRFEIGTGIAYNRLISFAPRLIRPKTLENAYVQVDSAASGAPVYSGPFAAAPAGVLSALESGDPALRYTANYWTQRGIKAMARASLDLGFLLPEKRRGPEDLRIFAEAAVLGWEDQVYYYENRRERIPIMAGMNLPALGFLDLLSAQVEYYPTPFNDSKVFNESGYPRWGGVSGRYDTARSSADDWKWSLHAAKSLNRLVKLRVQAASDHLRLPLFTQNPTETDLTRRPGNWYYLVRLECRL